ncbi:anthraniloyl-CoA monooxygenase [Stackebrandtia albiflava]|uniref:Anthraniloyl-CoA monooxygenase n=1 Tax=Stackebrandtia albiflava TaxID=406432 RepID=A0A562V102_9ACTN|nr:bifunctional salicylyl-CoA 5-hydroxylase/oxidoreductase [Stackebrandtia albiflava]TWJ11596.1 anthraniloyl-CoA monooxygenase [Stackebrandtia albiflava]
MRIAVIGGGPAGLYFAAQAQRRDPGHHIDVFERNPSGRTYGFGVVFSGETLDSIRDTDPVVHAAMAARFVAWQDIDVHLRAEPDAPGSLVSSTGHEFAAMSRRDLLSLLADRCRETGVRIRFGESAPPAAELAGDYDLVVAADGVRSATRSARPERFGAKVVNHRCRYVWLGTDRLFESFTFDVRATEHGVMQMHAYPYGDGSTVIIEMPEEVWRAARPGPEDCAALFADRLDGHALHDGGTGWTTFATVTCDRWYDDRTVLLGDAAHTAHFSIGSGTKLAMEDAAALAAALHRHSDVPAALAEYQAERQPVVASTQRAAAASLEWFEDVGQYLRQHPLRFAFNLLTRSRRITYDNLRLRDPELVDRVDDWFARTETERGATPGPVTRRPPMFQPFTLGGLPLRNRVVVSPMDMYSAVDGVPGDFHLVHLGSKALGGAGLVMTEMVCVSATGRITPGCTGLYDDAHTEAWRRVVEFVHRHSDARIGVQLGHSGRKGSTRLMWEGIDAPLPEGNWPLVAPSPLPYRADSQTPKELDRAGMAEIVAEFAAAARRARSAGFDLLELHCAHGYLLSSFISPLTNHRDDEYGGPLTGRMRFPLEVLAAVRREWPGPVTVRVSATDWHDDGLSRDESIEVARMFAAAGVDGVDVSCGQVVSDERPAYGRSFQTPYADRIRQALAEEYPDVAVIAVGAISSADDVNSIILAGRADLCALGRVHLWDPAWTLHAAADQEFPVEWPVQFAAGSRRPPVSRRV